MDITVNIGGKNLPAPASTERNSKTTNLGRNTHPTPTEPRGSPSGSRGALLCPSSRHTTTTDHRERHPHHRLRRAHLRPAFSGS